MPENLLTKAILAYRTKQAILLYLERHGPSFMEDIWVAVGEPWPWPDPLREMKDEGSVQYDSKKARWFLTPSSD